MQQNSGKLPDFLFVGAMKAATTTMSFQLGIQPGIFMVTNPKELYFFSYDHNYAQGSRWYKSKFSEAEPNDICGEAATTYTQLPTYPHVVERMFDLLPDAKLIYIMRHPIDRLVSQYLHEYTLRKIQIDINQAIYKHPELIYYSSYSMQLRPFLEKFGLSQVLPVFFERVHERPQAELERICQFIGYEGKPQWDFNAAPKNVTKNRPLETPWLRLLRKSKFIKPIRDHMLPSWFKTRAKDLLASNLEKPKISSKNLDYLHKVFNQDLNSLSKWLNVKLTCENFKEVTSSTSLIWAKGLGKQDFETATFPNLIGESKL